MGVLEVALEPSADPQSRNRCPHWWWLQLRFRWALPRRKEIPPAVGWADWKVVFSDGMWNLKGIGCLRRVHRGRKVLWVDWLGPLVRGSYYWSSWFGNCNSPGSLSISFCINLIWIINKKYNTASLSIQVGFSRSESHAIPARLLWVGGTLKRRFLSDQWFILLGFRLETWGRHQEHPFVIILMGPLWLQFPQSFLI